MSEASQKGQTVRGSVKWFDPGKGFGFVVSDSGGPDILLHANVLRNFGQGSVADGSGIVVIVQETARGSQASEVLEITPPKTDGAAPPLAELSAEPEGVAELPLEPARVKWFDKVKGFGFANIFGRAEDVFIHIEVLRRSGLADLQPGEAVGLRVVDGRRGRMAAAVLAWDAATRSAPAAEGHPPGGVGDQPDIQ
jgi:CspA family cold shock protein